MALLDGGQPAGFAIRGGQDAAGDAVRAVEAEEIPGVAFVEQFGVRFIQTDAGVPANQSQDQIDLLRVSANQSQGSG